MDDKIKYRNLIISDYESLISLWNSVGMSKRALNPVDDSCAGIERYIIRNPKTCFVALSDNKIVGVILSGHDGRRGLIHHLCVNPDYRRMGIASTLVKMVEKSLLVEGIQKILLVVFNDNELGNNFWEKQGYSLRTNLNYRNKSLNQEIPVGE